jgi:hypothetical protein
MSRKLGCVVMRAKVTIFVAPMMPRKTSRSFRFLRLRHTRDERRRRYGYKLPGYLFATVHTRLTLPELVMVPLFSQLGYEDRRAQLNAT